MITDSMVFFVSLAYPKFVSNIPKMCIKTYLNHPINQKNVVKKNNLRRSQFSKKGGGSGEVRS